MTDPTSDQEPAQRGYDHVHRTPGQQPVADGVHQTKLFPLLGPRSVRDSERASPTHSDVAPRHRRRRVPVPCYRTYSSEAGRSWPDTVGRRQSNRTDRNLERLPTEARLSPWRSLDGEDEVRPLANRVLLVATYRRTNLTMRQDRSTVRNLARRGAPGGRHDRAAARAGPGAQNVGSIRWRSSMAPSCRPVAPVWPRRRRTTDTSPTCGSRSTPTPVWSSPPAISTPQPQRLQRLPRFRHQRHVRNRPVTTDGGYQGNPEVITPYRRPRDGS